MAETKTNIIDTAERMMREGGYHSFSFRQIADELGVKSASIHYHFPSKCDLSLAVVARYTQRFLDYLGEPTLTASPIGKYVSAFEAALQDGENPCLCGILSGETGKLPSELSESITLFTEENLQWLNKALSHQCPSLTQPQRKERALLIFSALEGAISFAALTKKKSYLRTVGNSLKKLVSD